MYVCKVCLVSQSSFSSTVNGYVDHVAFTKEAESRLTQCILLWVLLFRLFSWKCCQLLHGNLLQCARIRSVEVLRFHVEESNTFWLCIASGLISVSGYLDTFLREKNSSQKYSNSAKIGHLGI